MKRFALVVAFLAVTGLAAAQQTQLDVGPGMVGPSSPLYGLETAWDNAAMSIGLKKPGTLAQERAAEVRAAVQANNSEAAQRAAKQLNAIAQAATSDDTQGLEKAAAVLNEVMQRVPQQAQQGLQTALNNIQQAGQRIGVNITRGPGQRPGGGGQVSPGERINQSRQLREQGRQALQRGNELMDAGNYSGAKRAFAQAESYFQQASQKLQGIQTTEAQTLRQNLQNAISGADNLEKSMEAYMDGDNQTAQQYANQAQQDFQQSGGGR